MMPDPANLEEILAAARRLPRKAQAELAETLLRDAGEPAVDASGQPGLETLRGMSETELVALSRAVVAPARQRRMRALLRKNTKGELGDIERQELDTLLEEADRIALLKARACIYARPAPTPSHGTGQIAPLFHPTLDTWQEVTVHGPDGMGANQGTGRREDRKAGSGLRVRRRRPFLRTATLKFTRSATERPVSLR
jgi:hypothetical protein